MSFLQFHKAHIMATTLIRIRAFVILSIPFNHDPNKFAILVGGYTLKVKCTRRHISRTNGHLIKRCSTDSSASQKTHFLLPIYLRLIKLSFVRISFLLRNHKKIFIFSGSFNFHRCLRKYLVCPFSKSA